MGDMLDGAGDESEFFGFGSATPEALRAVAKVAY